MIRLVFSLLLLTEMGSISVLAQSRTIKGIVKDAQSRDVISYCSVRLLHSRIETMTDIKGMFQIRIPDSMQHPLIVLSNLGYKRDTLMVNSGQSLYSVSLQALSGNMNEVIVTGLSKSTLARENPIPVILISSKKIEQSNESNIVDVLVKNVPGLNAVKTGPNISKPFIRGLGYNRVLTIYDGLRQEGQQWGDEHAPEIDGYIIEKAEVIKGPASLMFGSDALAGVVSFIPYIASEKDSVLRAKFISEYQSNNGLAGNGLQLAHRGKHWVWATNASYKIAKNYTNRIDGRVYNTGFREQNLDGLLGYHYGKGFFDLHFTRYNNLQGIPDGSRDSLSRKFTKQIAEGNKDYLSARPVVSDEELNSYRLSPLHQHIEHNRIYMHHSHQTEKGDIDFLMAWQQNIRREYSHPTAPQQAGMFVRLNTFNYSVRYHCFLLPSLEFSTGANGMAQDNLNKDATDFPIPNYGLFDFGFYTYAKWKLNKWSISGGFRYDTRYLQGDNFYVRQDSSYAFSKQVSDLQEAGAVLQFPSFNKRFDGISFSLGSTFALSDHINLKGNFARGYRAPNITEFASNGLDPGAHIVYLGNRTFVPEFSLQEDLGLNIKFNEFSADVSLFNNHIQHYIYLKQQTHSNGTPITDAQGNKTFQYEQAKARLYGLETSIEWHPAAVKGLSFFNFFSMVYGYNQKEEYKNKKLNGEYLPLIPPLKSVSSLDQNFNLPYRYFTSFHLKVEMENNAQQDRYLLLDNTETFTPAYTLFNIATGMEFRYTEKYHFNLQVQVNNLFDEVYQSNLSRLKYFEYYKASPNNYSGIYSMGRNICFKLIMPF